MLRRISEQIGRFRRFLITSHERPDGDAIGSELALRQILEDLGKESVVYNQDRTPGNYLFLPGSGRIVHELPPLEHFDAAFILDCSDLSRVGEEALRIGTIPNLIQIDHHLSNGGFFDTRLIDPLASSTAELIFRLIRNMGLAPTRDVATCLYTAILTDTGGFRYSNTRREALLAAADLVGGHDAAEFADLVDAHRFAVAPVFALDDADRCAVGLVAFAIFWDGQTSLLFDEGAVGAVISLALLLTAILA